MKTLEQTALNLANTFGKPVLTPAEPTKENPEPQDQTIEILEKIKSTKPKTPAEIRQVWKDASATVKAHSYDEARLLTMLKMERFSPVNYFLILSEMRKHNMEGTPYIDTLTFAKWKEAGFRVKKGEKSVLYAVSFPRVSKLDEEGKEETFSFAKLYHLFHRSQVEKI